MRFNFDAHQNGSDVKNSPPLESLLMPQYRIAASWANDRGWPTLLQLTPDLLEPAYTRGVLSSSVSTSLELDQPVRNITTLLQICALGEKKNEQMVISRAVQLNQDLQIPGEHFKSDITVQLNTIGNPSSIEVGLVWERENNASLYQATFYPNRPAEVKNTELPEHFETIPRLLDFKAGIMLMNELIIATTQPQSDAYMTPEEFVRIIDSILRNNHHH